MLAKRIIPCLDCDLSMPNGRVVNGTKFKQIRYAGIPWERAKQYYEQGADEICFLDITASTHKRETMVKVLEETCKEVFVPVTVGGGIKNVEDANKVFRVGADKVSINTAAIKNPKLVTELSEQFGNQAVVVAIDAKKRQDSKKGQWWECSIYGGREFTDIDALNWAKKVEELGAGEILLTSMDKDGTKNGFDLELTRKISETVNIPVIASGGAGNLESIAEAISEGKADAVLAASIFHFDQYSPQEVKEFLKEKGINVRLEQ